MNETKQRTNKKAIIIGGAALVLIAVIVLVIILTRAKPAVFEVSNLRFTPDQPYWGQNVTINVTVTNTGEGSGSYNAELKITDTYDQSQTIQTKSISLTPGEQQKLSFPLGKDTGSYEATIGGLTAKISFSHPPLPEAVYIFKYLTISPAVVRTGETVTISVTAINTNNGMGDGVAELVINGTIRETQSFYPESSQKTIEFSVTENETGTYAVEIGGLKGEFTVRPVELRTWVITDADIPRLFSMISTVSLTSHFIPGNQAEFVMAGFPGVVDIGVINGKLCEYPVSPDIYMLLPEIHDYIFFENGVEYLSYTWFDPAVEIAPDVTTMPVMVSVTTEDGKAIVIYEW